MAAQEKTPRRQVHMIAAPEAFANITDIDRRTCQRVVPLKVIALGPSRTGTLSLRQALIDLGYSDCYHYTTILQENPRDAEMWIEAMEAKFEGKGEPFRRKDWDQLLGHCMAVTDTPCTVFYRELLEAYPEAKVIVQVRDSPRQWWESQMNTIMPFFDVANLPTHSWSKWLWRKFLPAPTTFDRFNELLLKHYPAYQILSNDYMNGTENGIKWFEEYVDDIRRRVPKDRLLIMNVKEGWKPLCDFLGDEVPAHDFPKINTLADFEKYVVNGLYPSIDQAVKWNAVRKVGPFVVGLAAIAGVYLFRSRSLFGLGSMMK